MSAEMLWDTVELVQTLWPTACLVLPYSFESAAAQSFFKLESAELVCTPRGRQVSEDRRRGQVGYRSFAVS